MRYLILSDIHANLTALEAVLKEARGSYDSVLCLGDLVGYGPDPNECVELVHSLPNLTCLQGNHDAAAVGRIDLSAFNSQARFSSEWVQSVLNERSLEFLKNLPDTLVKNISSNGERITLAHGSPRNPIWEYILDVYTAAVNFSILDTPICLVGHTHLPTAYLLENQKYLTWKSLKAGEVYKIDTMAIINPGSVGQPRDYDPRSAYAIFDSVNLTWEQHRVSYDIVSVQKRIISAGLPKHHAERLSTGT